MILGVVGGGIWNFLISSAKDKFTKHNKGIADIDENPENVLNLNQIYIKNNKRFAVVFPLVVCSALDIARKTLEKDALFRINTTDAKIEKAIIGMLGEPNILRKKMKYINYL